MVSQVSLSGLIKHFSLNQLIILLFQFTNINKCKAGISISADTKCVNKIIIYIKIQVIL